ncbi:MAG TPA: SlyX family protein [Methylophaga aminisulfidivorans]|nr:SlyX family protein [Methylophaga aminisulfidivorans]HEC75150.1 SlyX family protein [Methylophaga aminisulfidivorans]
MEDDIIDLQTKLSFQDGLLEDLNQVIIGQQDQIARLELAIETLKVQMRTMQTSMHQGNGQEHEIPPHY